MQLFDFKNIQTHSATASEQSVKTERHDTAGMNAQIDNNRHTRIDQLKRANSQHFLWSVKRMRSFFLLSFWFASCIYSAINSQPANDCSMKWSIWLFCHEQSWCAWTWADVISVCLCILWAAISLVWRLSSEWNTCMPTKSNAVADWFGWRERIKTKCVGNSIRLNKNLNKIKLTILLNEKAAKLLILLLVALSMYFFFTTNVGLHWVFFCHFVFLVTFLAMFPWLWHSTHTLIAKNVRFVCVSMLLAKLQFVKKPYTVFALTCLSLRLN